MTGDAARPSDEELVAEKAVLRQRIAELVAALDRALAGEQKFRGGTPGFGPMEATSSTTTCTR